MLQNQHLVHRVPTVSYILAHCTNFNTVTNGLLAYYCVYEAQLSGMCI